MDQKHPAESCGSGGLGIPVSVVMLTFRLNSAS